MILITKDETFTRVDVETVAAINLFVGTDIKYDEKEEVVNMCKAWDDHKKLGIQEGNEARNTTRNETRYATRKMS